MWLQWYKYLTNKNKYVVSFSWKSRKFEEDFNMFLIISLLSSYKIEKIIVSNSIVKNRLIKHGIKLSKIILIPIGVDTNFLFHLQKNRKLKLENILILKRKRLL